VSTVMIVDDADLARATLGRLLEREGYHTTLACDGRDALSKLDRAEPDLIVLDLNMPGLDGLELLEILHSHDRWKQIPVIMLTAVADTHTVHRAHQLGAKEYLVKATFSVKDMLHHVRMYTTQLPH